MKNTAWYHAQSTQINKVRDEIHSARMDLDSNYRKKHIESLTFKIIESFLWLLLPSPLIPLARAILKHRLAW